MLLPPKVLNVVKAASDDAIQYQLTSVYIERKKDAERPSVTATDGKVLAQVTWQEENWKEFPDVGMRVDPKPGFSAIVPSKTALELSRTKEASKSKPILNQLALDEHEANGTVTFATTDLDTTRKLEPRTIDGAYPNYSSAMPDVSMGHAHEMLFNPRQMIRACEIILKSAAMDKVDYCSMRLYGKDRPILLEKNNVELGITAKAYVMPMVMGQGGAR